MTLSAATPASAGACQPLDRDEAVRMIKANEGMVWLDVLAHDRQATHDFLVDTLGLHELAVEDALSEHERPTLQDFESYIFFGIPAICKEESGYTYAEIGFFCSNHWLITVANQRCGGLDTWFKRWAAAPGKVGSEPGFLLHALVDSIVDDYFPAVDALEDELDELSDKVFAGDTTMVKHILELKRCFLEIRRRMSPIRDIMNGILRRDLDIIPLEVKPYFQDVFDHVIRISEIVDTNRDTLASLLDVHLSVVSNNLNQVVKKMTVLATVLMVMTLVAGIYGMNFRFMPELEWRFGYPFALAIMLFAGVGVLAIFKRMKWI